MKVTSAKFLAAATLATIAALGTANAADMSMPAPAYGAPPSSGAYSWTGCYIGGGGGYGWWTQSSFVQIDGVAETAVNTNGGSGWFGQGQGGCDYQFTTPIFNLPAVIGLFGDYAGGDIDGQSSFPPGFVGPERESAAWSVGGRFGILLTPRILSFFDGGWTQAHFDGVNYSIALPGGAATGLSLAAQTYNGWFLGSGFEYSLDWNWIPIRGLFLKTEYRYARYGGDGVAVPLTGSVLGVPAIGAALNSQKSTELVSTELVWRFNWH
jgi:outer membrane immunogenic protein